MNDRDKIVTVKMTALQAAVLDTCLEQAGMSLVKTVAGILDMEPEECVDHIFDLEMLMQPNRVRMLLAINEHRALKGE